ncbi:MAG: carbohydrate binding domain-containing protein, partial [Planctomycetota bacterium]
MHQRKPNTTSFLRHLTAAVAALAVAGSVVADDEGYSPVEEDWFEFVIPTLATEATTGTPIDLSFLNSEPAGANGFLRNDSQGNLVDEAGNVVRLFGTNICDWHVMPPRHLAKPIARRLQQLGVNFIRLHYYELGAAPEFIMQPNMTDVDADKRDEMFNLIAELKAAGIYVDINLHVARKLPGTPDAWGNDMSKGIDRVLPDLIEDGKHFARQILTVENPYTGLTLAQDPAVVAVEINNENSLMAGWWRSLTGLQGDAGDVVQAKWNAWLIDKYGDTDALRATWNGNLPPDGDDIIRNGNFAADTDYFVAEFGSGAAGQLETMAEDGTRFLRWTVEQPGLDIWNVQLHQLDVPAEHGESYVLRFKMRTPADAAPPVFVHLMRQDSDWALATSDVQVRPTAEWQEVTASWTIDNDTRQPLRLSIDVHNETGVFDIAELSLTEGALPGIDDVASLEEGTVPLPGMTGNGRSLADWRDFCVELDLAYSQEMYDFLRDDLGVRSMIWDTQVNYGGTVGLLREATISDAIDIHGYPTHPQFLGMRGETRIHRVEHKSMTNAALETLAGLSLWQVKDMPFFATEFDLNPPSQYQSETYPLLAVLAAYQGWDGFGEYAWLNFQGLDEA